MMGWGDNHEIFPEFVRQEFLDTFCRMSAHDDGPKIWYGFNIISEVNFETKLIEFYVYVSDKILTFKHRNMPLIFPFPWNAQL